MHKLLSQLERVNKSCGCSLLFGAVEDAMGKRRDVAVGCAVGDSRLYLLNREGNLYIVTDGAKKARLGSGSAEPFTFRIDPLLPGDVLLLLSDGAYTPLSMNELQRTVTAAISRTFRKRLSLGPPSTAGLPMIQPVLLSAFAKTLRTEYCLRLAQARNIQIPWRIPTNDVLCLISFPRHIFEI